MPRRKSAPQNAPSTLPEAIAIIERYLGLIAQIEELKASADESILKIQTLRDQMSAPLKAQTDDLFLQLRAWWGVAGPEITGGKTKSTELAGALIGERTTTPSLKLPKGMKAEDAVAFIKSLVDDFPGLDGLVRVKTELEKPAIIKLLRSSTAVGPAVDRIKEEGFSVAQREEFFIDRAAPKDPDPKLVDVPQPEIMEARS